ncbi:MAG: DUF4878 domain-containing protein [Prevotella sp.]|nr:DUF4878 domain-containing protein [Prevotella sp.]MBR6998811.1 DUF4878 domain-containing protein [Prevotella sp.]
MKKMIVMFTMCLMMMAMMTSCGSSHENTPRGVAEAAVKYLSKKDWKGYMDLTDANDKQKEVMAQMLEKMGKQLDDKGGMKSYEFVDEDIDEENGTATITVKVTYENQTSEDNKMKMLKKDGKWLLSSEK